MATFRNALTAERRQDSTVDHRIVASLSVRTAEYISLLVWVLFLKRVDCL
jgi:hypothetical protein